MALDPGSARVKEIARLSQKDARYETGLFLLEGPQGLKELAQYPELAQEIFVTESALERYSAEISTLEKAGVAVEQVSTRVMEKIADTKTPQGIVSVVHHVDVEFSEILETSPKIVVLLDRIQDPGNAGTIIRAADAAGADAVVFSTGSVDPYNSKVVRSTAGSLLNVPISVGVDMQEAVIELQSKGIQVLSTSAKGESLPELPQGTLATASAWIFGNEAGGVGAELAALADKTVSIPIYGSAESLNLATAASICLYFTAFAQRANH